MTRLNVYNYITITSALVCEHPHTYTHTHTHTDEYSLVVAITFQVSEAL